MSNTTDSLEGLNWFKASASSGSGGCVEVARLKGRVAVRDSKVSSGPYFVVGAQAFAALVDGVADESV
ncbi:DUF397 domain-containing protein [Streptomyces canus]|uniref:DUF397 domain-containing protein n=1 Tax=Streptomyces canus TaxID=58343 RepID=UPI002E25BEE5